MSNHTTKSHREEHPMAALTFADLKREVDEVVNRNPKLKEDQAFIVWFLRAYAGASEADASAALPGRAGEKGVDAVWVDDHLRQVFVVQGKYHKSQKKRREGREVVVFSGLASVLAGPVRDFADFCNGMEPAAKEKVKVARERMRRGYRLQLCFASTGICARNLEKEAVRTARRVKSAHGQPTRFSMFDGKRIMALLYEWLDGASPPVPSLDLPMVDEPIRWYDRPSGITLWIFWMVGADVADLFEQASVRIFHRNIRGYLGLGDNAINQAMMDTLEHRPKYFIYLNNGVTIVCDSANRESEGGQDVLTVSNPQIINGQQTTRVLSEAGPRARRSNVLVRVLHIPQEMKVEGGGYEHLVGEIVEATNRQNAIKSRDLRSNDRIQVQLERELGKLGYRYIRKRQSPAETRALQNQTAWSLRKEDLAKAVGACLEEGLPRRVGTDKLFREEEPYYHRIFRSDNPYYYLPRWWLMRLVDSSARGYGQRQWAKYVVLYFLWQHLGGDITRHSTAFVAACENPRRHPELALHITRASDLVFKAALRYFQMKRGKGKDRTEVSVFFKRRDVYDGFERYWSSRANPSRASFRRHTAAFLVTLKQA